MDPVVGLALRALLALLLGGAALAKLRDLRGFAAAVAGYRLLPAALAVPAAAGFVAAELALAAGLWTPLRAEASLGAAALLVLYAGAIAVNLARGRREIDCGCGGPLGRQSLSEGLVLRNLVWASAALACALPEAPRTLAWLDLVSLGAAVSCGAALQAASSALLARPAASSLARPEASR
jgi:hypothetical protein